MDEPSESSDPLSDELAELSDLMGPGLMANVLLADAAQASNGKLFILGGGVSVIGPKPQPLALAIRISVPWDRANVRHGWQIDLLDEDGRPATVNNKPLTIKGQFEAGRPAGLRPGTPLGVSLAVNITALPLARGRSYTFRLSIEDETRPEWQATFYVKPETQQQKQG